MTSSRAVSTLYVIRHADAGERSAWTGDDHVRPLNTRGRHQADHICTRLGRAGLTRLISSAATRCVETLEPLGRVLGLPVETDARLYEGSDGPAALALADEIQALGDVAALCTHGDVIPDLLSELRVNGTNFHHTLTWPKGSIWVLTGKGQHWTDADHIPVPKGLSGRA
jgi:phosphohistidine phosphatase SixA